MTKESLLPDMAAFVLEHGLAAASLRPLAHAAGTSDRMLLYHFGTKEALIGDLLSYVSRIYGNALNAAMADARAANRQECLALILAQGRDATMRPFMALWWEIVAGASRGTPGYRQAASAMMDELLGSLERQMPADDPDPVGGARYLLTLLEGTLLLGTVGHARTARSGLRVALGEGLLASDHAGD